MTGILFSISSFVLFLHMCLSFQCCTFFKSERWRWRGRHSSSILSRLRLLLLPIFIFSATSLVRGLYDWGCTECFHSYAEYDISQFFIWRNYPTVEKKWLFTIFVSTHCMVSFACVKPFSPLTLVRVDVRPSSLAVSVVSLHNIILFFCLKFRCRIVISKFLGNEYDRGRSVWDRLLHSPILSVLDATSVRFLKEEASII